MKKTLLFKQLALAAALAVPVVGNGQRLLEDNFGAYNAGNLEGQGSWAAYGSHTADPIQLVEASLSYPDYQETASGKAAELGTGSVGQDLKKTFSTGPIADLYYSALVSFKETTIDAGKETYFINLIKSGATTEFAKVYAKQGSTSSKIILGLTRNSDSEVVYSDEEIDCNSTHLIVVQYQSVPGATNDQVALYVNPTPEQNTPTVTYSGSTGSDVDNFDEGDGFDAIELRQGATYSKRAANVLVDAIRVSTTWAGLFNGTGEVPAPTPTINVESMSGYVFIPDNLFVGNSYPYTLTVNAENLQGDITVTIGSASGGEVTSEQTTIAKADAEAGYEFPFTIKPLTTHPYQDGYETITFSSEGAETVEITLAWSSYEIPQASTLAALKEEISKLNEDDYYNTQFLLTGEVTVTHAYMDAGHLCLFVEDATGGLKIVDQYDKFTQEYAVGDKLSHLTLSASVSSNGSITAYAEADFGAPLSQGNEVTPATLTLADLKANGARYEGCLVKVEEVTITPSASGNFGDEGTTPIYLKQAEGDNSTLFILPGADFIGKAIPESARSIIGISTSASGSAIAPRSLADIDADFDEPGGEDPGTEPGEPGNETEVGDNLLSNPSFEENSSNPLFGVQFTNWSLALGSATVESEIMQEGEAAIRITGSSKAYLEQEVRPGTFTAGDAYRLTIHYYIVQSQGDDDVQLACYWDGIDVTDPNAADLKQNFTGAVNTWETKTIRTVVPEGATAFYFHADIPSGAEVIFDNFSLYKLEAIATGLETVGENGLSAWAESGVLYLGSDREQAVNVYSLNGVLVSRTNLTPGINTLALPAGAYVLKADDHVQKVLVK